jgi:hypothetical protein
MIFAERFHPCRPNQICGIWSCRHGSKEHCSYRVDPTSVIGFEPRTFWLQSSDMELQQCYSCIDWHLIDSTSVIGFEPRTFRLFVELSYGATTLLQMDWLALGWSYICRWIWTHNLSIAKLWYGVVALIEKNQWACSRRACKPLVSKHRGRIPLVAMAAAKLGSHEIKQTVG